MKVSYQLRALAASTREPIVLSWVDQVNVMERISLAPTCNRTPILRSSNSWSISTLELKCFGDQAEYNLELLLK
jgi:hypothetical protein